LNVNIITSDSYATIRYCTVQHKSDFPITVSQIDLNSVTQ